MEILKKGSIKSKDFITPSKLMKGWVACLVSVHRKYVIVPTI